MSIECFLFEYKKLVPDSGAKINSRIEYMWEN